MKINLVRSPDNPIIPVLPNSWKEEGTLVTVGILSLGSKYLFYYGGKSGGHRRLGIMTIEHEAFDGKTWNEYAHNPILDIGPPGSYDSKNLVDPATVYIKGKAFLYYSALGDGPDSIALATSTDGYHFRKFKDNPVIRGRAPEIVYKEGMFYLFYLLTGKEGGYEIRMSVSKDGFHFTDEQVVLQPSASPAWDSFSLGNPRMFYNGTRYIMVYAGDDKSKDFPSFFGIAISDDLLHWHRYSEKPIFEKGEKNSWDGKAIWCGGLFKHKDRYYLWYEGVGGPKEKMRPQIGLAYTENLNV